MYIGFERKDRIGRRRWRRACLGASPSCAVTYAQCNDFPTSSPMTISGLLGGAMVVSSNRQVDWKPSLRHPHYLAAAPAPGSFLSVVWSGERFRWQHSRPSSGQGRTAVRRRPIGGPLGAWPNCRQCAECLPPRFISGLSWAMMGVLGPLGRGKVPQGEPDVRHG